MWERFVKYAGILAEAGLYAALGAIALFACAPVRPPVPPAVVLLAPPLERPAPTNLARVVVGVPGSGIVGAGDVWMVQTDGGMVVGTRARLLAPGDPVCPPDQAGCVALDLREPLVPGSRYEVRVSGRPPFVLRAADGPDDAAPDGAIQQTGCTLRINASEPVWASLVVYPADGGPTRSWSGDGLAASQVFVLDEAPAGTALVALVDLAENEIVVPAGALDRSRCVP